MKRNMMSFEEKTIDCPSCGFPLLAFFDKKIGESEIVEWYQQVCPNCCVFVNYPSIKEVKAIDED